MPSNLVTQVLMRPASRFHQAILDPARQTIIENASAVIVLASESHFMGYQEWRVASVAIYVSCRGASQ
jgi:S-adenosylmethionine/arginine decarboxylase-like enzyme